MCGSICPLAHFFFFQAEDGIRDLTVTGVQTCALPIYKSTERVAARRAAAAGELAAELDRLERYFESILEEQSSEEAIGTVSALAARRRTEEIRRSEVRATVHPVPLVQATVVMQRAEWQPQSARGRRGTFSAQRSLSGAAAVAGTGPHCGRPPAALVVCRHDHCG